MKLLACGEAIGTLRSSQGYRSSSLIISHCSRRLPLPTVQVRQRYEIYGDISTRMQV